MLASNVCDFYDRGALSRGRLLRALLDIIPDWNSLRPKAGRRLTPAEVSDAVALTLPTALNVDLSECIAKRWLPAASAAARTNADRAAACIRWQLFPAITLFDCDGLEFDLQRHVDIAIEATSCCVEWDAGWQDAVLRTDSAWLAEVKLYLSNPASARSEQLIYDRRRLFHRERLAIPPCLTSMAA